MLVLIQCRVGGGLRLVHHEGDLKHRLGRTQDSFQFLSSLVSERRFGFWWKNWLIGKDPDAGKDWRQIEKGTTEDEMVGWHHWLNGHEFERALGVGDGQGGLACCRPWVTKRWTRLSDYTRVILCTYSSNLVSIRREANHWVEASFLILQPGTEKRRSKKNNFKSRGHLKKPHAVLVAWQILALGCLVPHPCVPMALWYCY